MTLIYTIATQPPNFFIIEPPVTDFERLTTTFDSLGIAYTVRIHPDDERYKYLFYGRPRQWDDDFKTTNLDTLLCGNKFFEFEDGELVSY